MPVDPPAPPAFGSRLSPMCSSTASIGTSSASAAIWVSAVHAPVPMSAASISTGSGRAVDRRCGTARLAPPGRIGRRGDTGADQPAALGAHPRTGVAPGPAEPLGARRAGTRRGGGWTTAAALGVDARARCGCAARRVHAEATASSSIADSRANMPGASPGARIHDRRRDVEAGQPVRRPPVRRGVQPRVGDRGLLGELLDHRGLLDDLVAIAVIRPSASAPRRMRWIVGVRWPTRENICWRVSANMTGRPHHRAAIAASISLRCGKAFDPNAAADVGRDHPHLLGSSPKPGTGRRRWCAAPWFESHSVSESPSQRAIEVCISIGLLCSVGVVVGGVDAHRGARQRGRRRRRSPSRSAKPALTWSGAYRSAGRPRSDDVVGSLARTRDRARGRRPARSPSVSATTAPTTWPW